MTIEPNIGVGIIGVNVERFLLNCIQSVRACQYPQENIQIVYVDGGSRDNSIEIAKSQDGVQVISLDDPHPTPGKGRNRGWKYLKTPFIQFLDADTLLDPLWFQQALPQFNESIGAVCGRRKELFPDKNLFHVIGDLEWRYEVGFCRYFGGDVLIRREILVKTDGFDENLIAGEDPELSYRIRQAGYKILRNDFVMTTHDLNMTTFKQYLRRAFRSGYAYSEISLRFIREKEKLWARELLRIIAKVLMPAGIVVAGVVSGQVLVGIVAGVLVAALPFLRVRKFKNQFQKNISTSFVYAAHTAFVVCPQFIGVLRHIFGVLANKPLRNNFILKKVS